MKKIKLFIKWSFIIIGVIGIAGIPDDIKTWSNWLAIIDIEFIIRVFLLISVGLVLTYSQWWPTIRRMMGRKSIEGNLTPSKILKIYRQLESLTSIQKDRMIEQFIGEWLKAEGRVKDVSEGFNFLWVNEITVDIETADGIDMNLDFKKRKWESKLDIISEGDQITFRGQILYVSSDSISLENCEIIESR